MATQATASSQPVRSVWSCATEASAAASGTATSGGAAYRWGAGGARGAGEVWGGRGAWPQDRRQGHEASARVSPMSWPSGVTRRVAPDAVGSTASAHCRAFQSGAAKPIAPAEGVLYTFITGVRSFACPWSGA
jgi:hypothetical protein